VSVHVYFQLSSGDIPFKLNPSEIAKCYWIPLNHLLFPEKTKITTKLSEAPPLLKNIQNRSWVFRKSMEPMMSGFTGSRSIGIDIGDGQCLFGLTFYFTVYMMRIMKDEVANSLKGANKEEMMRNLNYVSENGLITEMLYKEGTFGIKQKLMNYGYHIKRQKQFESIVNDTMSIKLYVLFFLTLCCILHKFVYVPYFRKL